LVTFCQVNQCCNRNNNDLKTYEIIWQKETLKGLIDLSRLQLSTWPLQHFNENFEKL
jgi:hypothetical protein